MELFVFRACFPSFPCCFNLCISCNAGFNYYNSHKSSYVTDKLAKERLEQCKEEKEYCCSVEELNSSKFASFSLLYGAKTVSNNNSNNSSNYNNNNNCKGRGKSEEWSELSERSKTCCVGLISSASQQHSKHKQNHDCENNHLRTARWNLCHELLRNLCCVKSLNVPSIFKVTLANTAAWEHQHKH